MPKSSSATVTPALWKEANVFQSTCGVFQHCTPKIAEQNLVLNLSNDQKIHYQIFAQHNHVLCKNATVFSGVDFFVSFKI